MVEVKAVSAILSGLTPNTIYNYRLHAVSEASPDIQVHPLPPAAAHTFTTLAAPVIDPAYGEIGNPYNITASSIGCNAKVTTNGADTECVIQCAALSAPTSIVASGIPQTVLNTATPQPVTIADQALVGLFGNTTYIVRCRYQHFGPTVTSYSYDPPAQITTNNYLNPTVVTNAVSNIHANDAQLNGTLTIPLSDGGGNTYYWWEIGTAANVYNLPPTPEVNAGSTPSAPFTVDEVYLGLTASTTYYVRFAARRDNLPPVYGAEVNFPTGPGATANLSVVTNLGTAQRTPYSFHMKAELNTNGAAVDVSFEYWSASFIGGGSSVTPYASTPVQTIAHSDYIVYIGDHTRGIASPLLPAPLYGSSEYNWSWRVRTTQGGESLTVQGILATAPTPTLASPPIVTNSGAKNVDSRSGMARWGCTHANQRVWMQMEWGTTTALGTFSRWVSQYCVDNTRLHWSYADYMDGLSPNTTYYCKLWAWSAHGNHTRNSGNPLTDLITFTTGTESATPSGLQWNTSWANSVGTRFPFRGQRGPVPRDLRLGTGTRQYPRTATEHLNPLTSREVVWGSDGYTAAEEAYTIHVTPTSISTGALYPGGATFVSSVDRAGNCNLAKACRDTGKARIGDIIRVDGSDGGFQIQYKKNVLSGSPPNQVLEPGLSVGQIVTDGNLTAPWTAYVAFVGDYKKDPDGTGPQPPNTYQYSFASFRILTGTAPPRGALVGGVMVEGLDIYDVSAPTANIARRVTIQVSGKYSYQSLDLGSGTNANDAYWGASAARKPITGIRFQAEVAGQKWQIAGVGAGSSEGGMNGVFFKDFIIEGGATSASLYNMSTLGTDSGVGVWGFSDFESRFSQATVWSGFGGKSHFRPNSPSCPDLRRGLYSPANEHVFYSNSTGALGNGDWFIADCAITGTSGDGLKTHCGRSFLQETARSSFDHEYDPGRGNAYILRNTFRGGDNASPISNWGFFGTMYVDGFTHYPIPQYTPQTKTNAIIVALNDSGHGAWRNEKGYICPEMRIGTLIDTGLFAAVGNTSLVTNSEGPFNQISSIERVYVGSFTFGSAGPPVVTVNNMVAFSLLRVGGLAWDNGYVQFVGNYGDAGACGGTLPSLWCYPRWLNYTNIPFTRRFEYNQTNTVNGLSVNSQTFYEHLVAGYSFSAIL